MTQLLVSPPSSASSTITRQPSPAESAENWLDEHILALDSAGEQVTSPYLADEVTAYQIDEALLHANSTDAELGLLATRLAREHFAAPGGAGPALTPALYKALAALREELRQQPELPQPA